MGEAQEWLFEPSFNRAVKICESDDRITSDAGLVLLREADHRLGLTEWLAQRLGDPRRQDVIWYQLVELLRARLYALAQGYSAQDDADRLAHDPAMKMAVWDRPGEQTLEERLASQPSQSRLIDILTLTPGNRAALRDALGESCERHLRATGGDHAARRVTVDIDSFPMLRIEYEAATGCGCDLGRFQRDLLKAGGRVVKHSRRLLLSVAQVVAPFWELLATCLHRWKLPIRFPPPRGPRSRAWMPPPRHAFLYEVRRC